MNLLWTIRFPISYIYVCYTCCLEYNNNDNKNSFVLFFFSYMLNKCNLNIYTISFDTLVRKSAKSTMKTSKLINIIRGRWTVLWFMIDSNGGKRSEGVDRLSRRWEEEYIYAKQRKRGFLFFFFLMILDFIFVILHVSIFIINQ